MFHHLKFPEHDLELNSPSNILIPVLFLALLVTFLWDLALFLSTVCFVGSLVLRGVCLEYWTALLCSYNYASLYLYPQRGVPRLRLRAAEPTLGKQAPFLAWRTRSSTVPQFPTPLALRVMDCGTHTPSSLFIRDYLVSCLSAVFQKKVLRRI